MASSEARCSRPGACCGATRSATAGTTPCQHRPSSGAPTQSKARQPRRPPRSSDLVPAVINFFASNPLQPLIDIFESILKFFHDTVGLQWGWAIIALTVLVRACLLPLTFKQFHSMQRLAHLQPEMKKIQERYKGDKERQNQEMMKFYRENKVNPFASCLPMVAQFPVFISLYYMLRVDLRRDICPEINGVGSPHYSAPIPVRGERRLVVPVHPGPDEQGHGRRADRADRPVRRLADGVDAADVDDHGPQPAAAVPGAAVPVRDVRDPLPGRPARLLDHHEPVDDRAADDHPQAPGPAAPGRGTRRLVGRVVRRIGGPRRRRRGRAEARAERRARATRRPRATASWPRPAAASRRAGPTGRPPSPPRKKKKRSGRRR